MKHFILRGYRFIAFKGILFAERDESSLRSFCLYRQVFQYFGRKRWHLSWVWVWVCPLPGRLCLSTETPMASGGTFSPWGHSRTLQVVPSGPWPLRYVPHNFHVPPAGTVSTQVGRKHPDKEHGDALQGLVPPQHVAPVREPPRRFLSHGNAASFFGDHLSDPRPQHTHASVA